MKAGRNQPCPCGSGKKFKKCCLGKEKVSSDLLYRRLGEAHDRLAHRLVRYGLKLFGEDALGVALDEFLAWPDDGIANEDLGDHQPLFYPWFIFNWEYEADPDFPQLDGPEGTTIADLYAANKADRLNHLEAQIIKAAAGQPFSFYEIQEIQPGQGYRLKDILRGAVSNVIEKKGSETARRGDILFARVAQVDSIAMLIGCGTVLVPPRMKPELIRFRQWLLESDDPITSRTMYEYDLEIRELYFNIFYSLVQPPELQNTDGDPLSFHTIYYEIDSPDLVFERLKVLAEIISETELRETADQDESGRIIRAEVPWSRKGQNKTAAMENTVLGQLAIDKNRLKVEVNSARRAEIIRAEIETRLGKHARCITTEIQSPESMLQTAREQDGDMTSPDPDHEKLMQMPEVREHLDKMLSAHWKNWIDEKIPALGHMTPRQAVKDPDGRESVEALLLDAERSMDENEHMRDAGKAAVVEVRRRLGLDKPVSAKKAKAGGGKNADRVAEVKRLVEAFSRSRLGQEYTGLALKLCDTIGRMRKLSIQRGRTEIWSAAIVHVIARLNFLFDPDNEVYITVDELNTFFGTKKSTVSSKAGVIQKTAKIFTGDPDFSTAKIANMFRLYETEDGLLIPAPILDAMDNQESENETQPGTLSHPAAHNTQRRSESQAQRPTRDLKKKDVDDRQLKLFDDES
ncbi:SEC-C domain-containing protein [bacterium]|nr:SEC-C domain-containing protein [bacterium]